MRPPTRPHSMAPLCFQLHSQIPPRTLAIGSAENYTKRGPSSPGEASCLLSAAGDSCQLDPFYFTLQLLHLFLASPASAAPAHSQRTLQAFPSARGARRRQRWPRAAHTNLSKMQSPRAPERNRQPSPQRCLGEGKQTQRFSAGVTAALRRQELFPPPELLERPRLPQTDAEASASGGGQPAATGRASALGLGQPHLHGASGAGRGSGELWRAGQAPGGRAWRVVLLFLLLLPRHLPFDQLPGTRLGLPRPALRLPAPPPPRPAGRGRRPKGRPHLRDGLGLTPCAAILPPASPSTRGTAHAPGTDGAPEGPDPARARRAADPRFGQRGAAAARGSPPGANKLRLRNVRGEKGQEKPKGPPKGCGEPQPSCRTQRGAAAAPGGGRNALPRAMGPGALRVSDSRYEPCCHGRRRCSALPSARRVAERGTASGQSRPAAEKRKARERHRVPSS